MGRGCGAGDVHLNQRLFRGLDHGAHHVGIHPSDTADPKAFDVGQFAGIDDKALIFHQIIEPAEIEIRVRRAEEGDDDWR